MIRNKTRSRFCHPESDKRRKPKLISRCKSAVDPAGSDLPLLRYACEIVLPSDLNPAELHVMRRTGTSPRIARLLAALAGVGCQEDRS